MYQGYSNSGRVGMDQPGYGQPAVIGYAPNQQMGGMGNPAPNPLGQQQQFVVTNQMQAQIVNIVPSVTFGTKPISITCQFCKNLITTQVEKSCNCCSCLLCCWTGFIFWVCIQACRNKEINCCDATHRCPSCGQLLGSYTSC